MDNGPGGRLSGDEASAFVEQLAGITRSGLPLGPGLRALAEELPSRRLGRELAAVADRVDAGATLEQALDDRGTRFPPHLGGLLAAGFRAGRMGEVLERFVRYERIGADLRRGLWLSLAYPILLLLSTAAVLVFVSAVVVLDLSGIYKDFGIALPQLTQTIITTAEALAAVNLPWLLGLIGALVAFWVGGRVLLGESWYRWVLGRLPVIGKASWWTSLAEFCHLLAILLEAGLPLPEAVGLAGRGVRDPDVGPASRRLQAELAAGVDPGRAIRGIRWFPDAMADILAWAQTHQSLPEALHMVAEMFEARARAQTSFVGTFLTVFMTIAVLFTVAITVGALFVPLIQLISRLSG